MSVVTSTFEGAVPSAVRDFRSLLGSARLMTDAEVQTLDPQGILSPGKQGIWPRGLRPDHTEG